MERSILLVFAHPDDESFGAGGTACRYSGQGIPVDLITATRGEKGARVDVPDGVDTGVAREAELKEAASIMGIRGLYILGCPDGGLADIPAAKVIERVAGLMRTLGPAVVITFGPDGITGHPDHVAIGQAATAAYCEVSAATGGPQKLYWSTLPEGRAKEAGWEVATRPDDEVTTVIDVSACVDRKRRAIAAHRSQPDARDFLLSFEDGSATEADRELLAHEYFYLVNGPAGLKEADLFQPASARTAGKGGARERV